MKVMKIELCGLCLTDFIVDKTRSRGLCRGCRAKVSRIYGKIAWKIYLETGGFKGYGLEMKQKFISVARRKMGVSYNRLKMLLDDFNITEEKVASWLTPEEFELYKSSLTVKPLAFTLTPQTILELSSRGA